MPAGSEAPIDPRFANLDANATIELCSSLADYGEAGGLSRDLMMQVGRFAEARYADDLEVLLAVARMYLLGGEAERARGALTRAGQLGPQDARVSPLLAHVLELIDEQPEGGPSASSRPSPSAPRALSPPPRSEPALPSAKKMTWGERRPTLPTTPAGKERRSFTPTTPIKVERRTYTPTSPMTRMPGHGPSKATTPMVRPKRASPTGGTRAVAAARAPDESPASAQIRTDVSRRVLGHRASGDDEARDSGPARSSPAPASRIRILEPDDPRRKLDPYELIGEIASGGMATVFLGRLAGAGGFSRFVAIKQLHPHLAREEQFVQMFLDEARLAAGIHNPHVVPILEVGMSRGGYFLVMEFIEGDTLAGLTARSLQSGGILPAPVALRIMIDALTGLHAAHQLTDADGAHLGLVHRDCTPQNILVGVDGSARITDFGVARAASRLAITRPQQVKGKVAYLSPEQAHAMDLDRRSDVFTMGIVLWETLAGRPLFQADTEATTLSRVVSGPIPSVRSFVPDVPVSLDEVCRRALHRDRNRRFRTAAEMAEAIERAAQAEGFGGVAPSRDLGKFVEVTMGAELLAQREAVRGGLSPKSSGTPSVGASSQMRPPPSVRGAASLALVRGEPASEIRARADDPPAPSRRVAEKAPAAPPTAPPSEEAARAAPPSPPAAAVAKQAAPPLAKDSNPLEETLSSASTPPPKPSDKSREPVAPPPTRSGLLATLRALLARAAAARVSTGRGIALAALLVIIATAPIWLKASNRLLHRGPATADDGGRAGRSPHPSDKGARSNVGAPPAVDDPPDRSRALPQTSSPTIPAAPAKAWDEGDWALPEAGVEAAP